MSAEFSFQVDSSRDLVRIRMGGFFTPEDIAAFLAARHEAHKLLTCRRNAHVTLNDIRDMKIQSQESVDAFRAMLAAPDYRSRRLAFIVSPTLARTQVMRALDRREARCFEDMWRAEAWLFARESAAA
ncbi:MAG: STAS/SEC14 domain-containing protein [Pseudomonadota bacterium]